MKALMFPLVRMLSDGEFHSSDDMASALAVSRRQIWTTVGALQDSGLTLCNVRGLGYRLEWPLTLLDPAKISTALGARAAAFRLELLDHAESTNSSLLRRANEGAPPGTVVAAEWQSRGRGRRGRAWHSPPGLGLTFSLLWRFQRSARFLSGLSLATGIAVARALVALGACGVGLKWPNDVLWRGNKLGGILIEAQSHADEISTTVIGIGLNCRLPDAGRANVEQAVADLVDACGTALDRNFILGRVLVELERAFGVFGREGLTPFLEEWKTYDSFYQKAVNITLDSNGVITGTVMGISDDGSLVLDTAQGRRVFHAGEISLRAASAA